MTSPEVAARLLLVVAIAIAAARVVGAGAVRLGQPRVIGEVLAGIVLGPSLLGAIWPAATDYLFPAEVRPALAGLAQLALVLFMFLVGVELDLKLLAGRGRTLAYVELGSLVVPFVSGALFALWLYPRFGSGTDRLSFVLFIGAAMSITAFPVLVRILHDCGLAGTSVGTIAVAAAALDDVAAWCLLAVAVAVASSTGIGGVLVTAACTGAFLVVMVAVVRPLLARLDSVA
ncbi:MAG: cation:proton antiporter, partial [Actinomycetes bacterium]